MGSSLELETVMALKSEEDLGNYLIENNKYTPEAITAALAELQKRGRRFTEEELENASAIIRKKYEKRDAEEALELERSNRNVVDDADAPVYYSQRTIWGFSVFFTVIFGAILLSSNIKEDPKAKWLIIAFGILYTAIAIVVLNQVPRNTALTFAVNGIGAVILTSYFWNKSIGKDVKYRAKPIWKPLIISIIITIPFVWALVVTNQQ